MKTTVLLFIYIFISNLLQAQLKQVDIGQSQYNMLKYWNLRDRMDWWIKKDVAHVYGNCPSINSYYGYGLVPSHLHIAKNLNTGLTTSFLQFGDSGQQLGWYLAVLATEYELLKRHGLNTDRTLEDLYYAMEAVFRVDYLAENMNPYSTNNHECSHNGFFIRADIGKWTVQGSPEIWDWYDNPRSPYPNLLANASGADQRFGSLPDAEKTGNCRDQAWFWAPGIKIGSGKGCANAMSQDQVAYLFMGLTFVDKLLPDQSIIVNLSSGTALTYNFVEKTEIFVTKLMDRLWKNNYKLRYPKLGNKVTRGHDAYGIGYGLREIAMNITGENKARFSKNFAQRTGILFAWDAWSTEINYYFFNGEDHKLSFILTVVGASNLKTDKWLERHCHDRIIVNLMRRVLYNRGLTLNPRVVEDVEFEDDMLTMDCYGPRRSDNAEANPRDPLDLPRFTTSTTDKTWYGGNPYIGGIHSWDSKNDDPKVDRQFVGLGYMLLFNLYQIYTEDRYNNSYVEQFRNYKHNEPYPNYPVLPNGWGSTANPALEFSFHPLEFEGTIGANSEVYMVSHDKVSITPQSVNQETRVLGNFRGYARPFDCKDYPGPSVSIYKKGKETEPVFEEDDEDDELSLFELLQKEFTDQELSEVLNDLTSNGFLTESQLDSLKSDELSNTIRTGLNNYVEHQNQNFWEHMEEDELNAKTSVSRPQVSVFPNPFESGVKLTLELPEAAPVTIKLYTVVGKEVKTLAQGEELPAGAHARSFDLSDLPGGAYVCKVWIGGDFQSFKLMKN